MRKTFIDIAIFTGSRSEYGLLRYLISEISDHSFFNLKLIIGGSHLSKKHGLTIKEIENDCIVPAALVPISLESESGNNIGELTAECLNNLTSTFKKIDPKLLIVLGDRYETFAAATAAHFLKIPVCHLHGGETTEGALDDRLRHAITQLSSIHFCAAEVYKNKILHMGQPANSVFNIGPMVIDAINNEKLISKQTFSAETGFCFGEINLIATYHPETLADDLGISNLTELMSAIPKAKANMLFTLPNADPGNNLINNLISNFKKENIDKTWVISSLGQRNYLSALKHFDGVIGNSSSGIIEAPLMGIPVLNIGDRQKGRMRYGRVIDAGGSYEMGVEEGFNTFIESLADSREYINRNKKDSPAKKIIKILEILVK